MTRVPVSTDQAPAAIGTYSQAILQDGVVYLSGQIPLDPASMELVGGSFTDRVERVFDNLAAVCNAAGGQLSDLVKINVYLTDLERFGELNAVMERRFEPPFPARAVVQVAALPKGVDVEIDGIMTL